MARRSEPPGGALDRERHALAFPGQGIVPTDACDVLRSHGDDPLVQELLGRLPTDDVDSLNFRDTRISQPCTFLASYLNARDNADAELIEVVIGHSLGELTALAWAGALTPESALSIAFLRGALCADANEKTPGAMAAFMQIDMDELELIRRLAIASVGGVLDVAAVNGPQQIVLSGSVRTLERAVEEARRAGGLVIELGIGGGFHSPIMAEPFAAYSRALAGIDFSKPRCTYVSTIHADVADEPDAIRRALGLGLLLPVRWMDSLHRLHALGVTACADAGPGETLRKLGQRSRLFRFSALAGRAREPR